jgi:acetolactate synthase regulatory subunit
VNQFTLQLSMKQSEGVLVRLLSVIRKRRYEVLSLTAIPSEDGSSFNIQATIGADRSAAVLVRQIEKLVDVSRVEVVESGETGQDARAAGSGT